MSCFTRMLAASVAVLALAAVSAPATAQSRQGGGHGWHGHRHWAPGLFWGGVGIGIGLGYHHHHRDPWYPGYAIVERPPVDHADLPLIPREPAVARAPDPVIYPRNGQTPAQTEADRQDCNRWATTQPSAMADASVFQRATMACMEGRGYTVK